MLKPLSEAHSRELLERLLPGAELSVKSRQEIIDKSAGNPFYLEEVVRSLIDGGAVVPDEAKPGRWQVTAKIEQITVPDTLQGAIIARVDRLTEDARKALQMAAVIGRRFQAEILRSLAGGGSTDAWLSQLERNNLVRQTSQTADMLYDFSDALVQEVAYSSLLVQQRQELHCKIGETLEAMFEGRLEQVTDLLCYHYSRSDNRERAIKYLEVAGQKAKAEFANSTAIQLYSELLDLIGEDEGLWQKRFEVLSWRQQIYGLLGQQDARRADLEVMGMLARVHADGNRRADALTGLADLAQWTGRYAEAEQLANESLALELEHGDVVGQARALHLLGVVNYYRGNYAEAQTSLEQAAVLKQAMKDTNGEAWSLMYLGMIHFLQGSYSEALRYHQNAFQAAESRNDWYQMGIHLTNAARVLVRMGDYERALSELEHSLEMKIKVGNRMGEGFARYGMGQAYTYLRRYDEAEEALQASLALRQKINDERGVGYCLHGLGRVALERERFEQAEAYFQQAYEARLSLGLKPEMIADSSFLSRARLGLGCLDEALEASNRAMALLAEQANVEEPQQLLFNHFRVLSAVQDPSAPDYLQQAYDAMMRLADAITEPEKRQRFLSNVPVNQAIMAELERITL
jgi:predicted ATPase